MMSFKVGDKVVCMNTAFPNKGKTRGVKLPKGDKVYRVRNYSKEWDVVYLENIYNPKLDTKLGSLEIGFATWRFADADQEEINFEAFDDPDRWRRIRL